MTTKATKKVAPDGGWGWVACFGVSLVNLATRAIEPSFGLLFGDLLDDLGVATTGSAIIMSAYDVTMNFSGLFVGPLLKEFSYRKVAVVGSLLCALGLALTSPANSMAHILATYSVINGFGVGLATSAAFVALNHYFKVKRGQAVGLSMAGTAAGTFFLPQIVKILLEAFGFRGAVLMISGLALHAAAGSMLLQPVKWHMKEVPIEVEMATIAEVTETKEDEDELPEMKTLLYNKLMRKNHSELAMSTMASNNSIRLSGGKGSQTNLPRRPTFPRIMSSLSNGVNSNSDVSLAVRQRKTSVMTHLSHLDFSGSNLQVHMNIGDEEAEEEDKMIRRVNTALGMSSMTGSNLYKESFGKLRNASFENGKTGDYGLTMAMDEPKQSFLKKIVAPLDVGMLKDPIFLNLLFGLSSFYVAEMNFKLVTPFFLRNLGYSKGMVAHCLSVAAITDIISRVIIPPICDRINISKRLIFMCAVLCVAITRSILAEQTDFTQIMIWLSICGFFRGVALSNFTLTVAEYCSLEQLPAAFGWHMVGKGVFVVLFGPLIGAIRDWTNSFSICLHTQSCFILLCCFAWSMEYLYKYMRSRKSVETVTPVV